MKSKLVIGILALALLFCQGIVFAESTDVVETAKATAEDAVTGDDDSLDMMAEDESAAPADELYTPAEEPAAAAPEASKM